MLIGYARVSKADGSQSLDLQRDALRAGVRDDRPGLDSCVRARRPGDVLVVWKFGRLGRNLATWSTPCRTCRPVRSQARISDLAVSVVGGRWNLARTGWKLRPGVLLGTWRKRERRPPGS